MGDDLFKACPEFPKIRLWPYQWISFPLLFLIPLLALLGFMGPKSETLNLEENGLKAHIEYPTIFRQGQYESIRITLSNSSQETIKDISLLLDNEYIKKFDSVTYTPNHVNASLELKIGSLPPNESHFITLLLKTTQFGHHTGVFKLVSHKREAISYEIKTVILP